MPIQMFLKLDGVEGESTDAAHKGEIDVLAWSWGLSDPAPAAGGGGAAAGKVAIQALSIQKRVDLSSPSLLLLAAEGKRAPAGVLTNRHTTGGEFLILKLNDVLVTSVAIGVMSTADQVAETVTLAFGKIEFDYRPTLPNGGLRPPEAFRWDIARNAPF